MALGSLIDAGADAAEVEGLCRRLDLAGWSLEFEPVLRAGIAATKAHVTVPSPDSVRTAGAIVAMIGRAALPPRVAARATTTFQALAYVEGQLHRQPVQDVHFHEVGAVDSIIDIVGTCAALEVLGIDDVYASPVALGRGMVRSAHGLLPNPAPATVRLLQGAPTYGVDLPIELTTPTGAALLAATVVSWGPLPSLTVESMGFGAGSREIDGRVNAVQVVVGVSAAHDAGDGGALAPGQPVMLLETNVDDVTGETLAHAVAALLEAGALDAWLTPVLMKKGRPGYVVSVLCDLGLSRSIASVLTSETGSFGIRSQSYERWPASRQMQSVEVGGETLRVKVGPGRSKVEFDDAARAAARAGPARTRGCLAGRTGLARRGAGALVR